MGTVRLAMWLVYHISFHMMWHKSFQAFNLSLFRNECVQKSKRVCTPYQDKICQTIYNEQCYTKYRQNCYEAYRDVMEPYTENICVDKGQLKMGSSAGHILPIVKVNTKNRYKLQYLHQGSQMNRQVQKYRYNSKVIMAFWENATSIFWLC